MAVNRKCVFCENTDLSKEHIFAQWLLKELGIFDNNVTMTHATFVGMPVSDRKHPFSKLVNGLVCKKCNNGWMSQLEGDCQNHIINLMNFENIENEMEYLKKPERGGDCKKNVMKQGKIYTKLILGLLLSAVVAYMGFALLRTLEAPLSTVRAIEYEAGTTCRVTGFVVRDETVLTSPYGITVLTRREGERVGVGQPLGRPPRGAAAAAALHPGRRAGDSAGGGRHRAGLRQRAPGVGRGALGAHLGPDGHLQPVPGGLQRGHGRGADQRGAGAVRGGGRPLLGVGLRGRLRDGRAQRDRGGPDGAQLHLHQVHPRGGGQPHPGQAQGGRQASGSLQGQQRLLRLRGAVQRDPGPVGGGASLQVLEPQRLVGCLVRFVFVILVILVVRGQPLLVSVGERIR